MNVGFMMVTVPKDKTETPVWTEVEHKGGGQGWKPVPASQSKFIPKSEFNELRLDEKKTKTTFPHITNGKVFPTEEETASKADSNVRSFMRERRAE